MGNHQPQTPEIREVTRNVFMSIVFDIWPNRAGIVDFGLDTQRHYAALHYAVREDGVSLEQLESALGNGPALTALVGPNNPYRGVTFKTTWDEMRQLEAQLGMSDGNAQLTPEKRTNGTEGGPGSFNGISMDATTKAAGGVAPAKMDELPQADDLGRYQVTVVETITNWIYVEVEAENPDDAKEKAEDLYDPDAFHDSRIEIDCLDVVRLGAGTPNAGPTRRMDETAEEEPNAAGTRWLSVEEIDGLSSEDFDALPAADKQRYYRYMDQENFPPQDEL